MREDQLGRALDACYEAVSTPELWGRALHDLAASLGSACAMFYPKDVGDAATLVPSSLHYSDLLQDYVAGGWYENHYRANRGWPLLESNSTTVVLEHDLATEEERRRLAHYHEFYLKWGYPGFAAIGFRIEGQKWCLPLLRSVSQGHFSRDEARHLALLSPDLRRMMHLTQQFAQARAASGLEALDRVDRAAFLVDWRGHVVERNARADALLSGNAPWLCHRDGRLRAMHSESDRTLQALLSTAGRLAYRVQRGTEARTIRIERDGRRPLVAELVSLRDLVTLISPRAFGVLLVLDPDDGPAADEERLRMALGLTPAEARLSVLLAAGHSVEAAADRLGISLGTARVRLKTIFHKTDTHRQGELIALVGRLM